MTAPTNKLDGAMMTTLTRERRASLEWAIEAAVTKGYTADADVIRDLLSELLSASKPAAMQGWKLVPIEPTVGMPVAGGLVPRGQQLSFTIPMVMMSGSR